MSPHRSNQNAGLAWGGIAGSLMAAFVILAGILRGVDPVVILQRAAIASLTVGLAIHLFATYLSTVAIRSK